jgi:hypothetical protein
MRKNLLVGLVLAVAAVLVAGVSAWLDLELESVALFGVTLGAVLALVPDRSPFARLAGFAVGFVIAWIGYFLRAAVLPDSTSGRAIVMALVIALAVAALALSMGRMPLWSGLLGVAALVGAYEYTYAAAPPEVASTSVSAATALLFTVAVGFLATVLVAPTGEEYVERSDRAPRHVDDDVEADRLDDMMMETK